MDDYLGRFRTKVGAVNQTLNKQNDLISKSTSKTEVLLERLNTTIPVVFINKDKEGISEAIMYSYKEAEVKIADYIQFLNRTYLVVSEIKNLERENYIDAFRLVHCNIELAINNETVKAFFKGYLRSVGSEESNLSQNFGVDSLGESFIVIPSALGPKINKILKIKEKGWRTTFIDNISNDGISYVALEEYNLVDFEKSSENEIPVITGSSIEPELPLLKPGITHTFSTESGFIKTNQTIDIIERASSYVKFIIPFSVENITIEVKQNGSIVSEEYKVRG